jgi:hypothetical protein
MAEQVTDTSGDMREGLGDGLKQLREDVSRENIESRLDDTVSERPLLKHLLDLRLVVRALVIAAVVTLIVSLLFSPKLGAALLVIVFGASWFLMAYRQYDRRTPTRPADEDEDSDSDSDSDSDE